MVEEKDTPKKDTPRMELTEVMLAMDVVDTLRHRQSLAERELSTDVKDQALIEKIRRIYHDQGLAVSEEIIAQGVAAMREERFVYRPPGKSMQLLLARIYVRRGRWAKLGATAIALLLAAWLAYQVLIAGPAERRQTRQARQLEQVWQRFQDAKLPPAINQAGKRLYQAASQNIESGEMDTAAVAVSRLETLVELPAKLSLLNETVRKEARVEAARGQADSLYRDGMAALAQSDFEKAQIAARSLGLLNDRLNKEYTLRIVSRVDARSGVWRQSETSTSARNYYIIVEAIGPDGKMLTLPVTSEEDGNTRQVDTWGLRVDERVYEQVKKDKLDNGIIDQNRFGSKKRGYLEPEFAYPTSGGAITQW